MDYGPYYFNYSTQSWSTSSSDLVAIPADGTQRNLFFYPYPDCTQKSTYPIDLTRVQSYTGSVWTDYYGNTVSATGDAYQMFDSGTVPPCVHLRVETGTPGTYNLFLGIKHSGAILVEYGVTFVVKIATVTGVNFNTRTGDTLYSQIVNGESALNPSLTAPTRNGYTLDGWYTSSSGGDMVFDSDFDTVAGVSPYTDSSGCWIYPSTVATLYAHWTEKTYSVSTSFTNVGSGSISKNSSSGGSTSLSGVKYATDTVTLVWTAPSAVTGYTLTFYKAYFEGYDSSSGLWRTLRYTNSDSGSLTFNFASNASGYYMSTVRAVVVYKKYALVTVSSNDSSMGTVTVVAGTQSASGASVSLNVEVGTTANISANVVAGYALAQWSDGSTSTPRTITVSSAVTLTATFQLRTLTVYVSANSHGSITTPSGGSYSGNMGGRAPIVAAPDSGYAFTGWTTRYGNVTIDDASSASTYFTFGTGTDTIYANFGILTSTINLSANCSGGSSGSGTINYGASRLTVSSAPTRTDSNFSIIEYYLDSSLTTRIAYKSSSSWVLDASVTYRGTAYTDSSGCWLRGSTTVTFYAKWQGVSVTVSYDANGGTVTPTSETKEYGQPYTTLPIPTNTDESLTFVGWFLNDTMVTVLTTVSTATAHTLTAHWTEGVVVTFNANGGVCDTPRKAVTPGQTYGTLPTPTYAGKTFGGWWTAESGGTRVYSYTTVTETVNHTLYAIWTVETHTFTLSYNANGGSGAPSSESVTAEGDSYAFTVSETAPTKSGTEFVGWAASSSATFPEYLGGASVVVTWDGSSASLTLYAVWMSSTPVSGEAKDCVRIYKPDSTGKAPGSAYIDVTDRLTVRSSISEVESYGMTASFTIVNGEGSDNLLSSSHAWSSGTGAIDTGQFVSIRHGSSTGMQWGWFFITSINVSDDLIAVTCGDYIQWLRANGAEYYRNHYDPTGYNGIPEGVHWDSVNSQLYIDKPSGVTLTGGSVGDVKIMVPATESVPSTSATSVTVRSIRTYYPIRPAASQDPDEYAVAIASVTLAASGTADAIQIRLFHGDSVDTQVDCFCTGTMASTGGTFTLPNPIQIQGDKGITIQITPNGSTHQKTLSYAAKSDAKTVYNDGSTETTRDGVSMVMTLGLLKWDNATGEALTDTTWKITSVASGTAIDSSLEATVLDNEGGSSVKRGWIEYMDPTAGVSISEVLRNICGYIGCTVAAGSMSRSISMFRCAGGYYHDYLLALADMTEDEDSSYEGRQHAFACAQSAWGALIFGLRRRASSDTSVMTLCYGGDTVSGATKFMSFTPTKTMQYRPCKAVSKGLDNDGNPIIVCMKDPSVTLGSSSVAMESTDTSAVQSALNAYNVVMKNRSCDWEGEVVIDGIHPEVMTRMGVYVGGCVVTLYDSRYGMSGLKARVREAKYDYQELTTTLVLNNYSEDYSNSITDTSKMAYSAGTMSLAVSGEDMYLRQYIFLDQTDDLTVDPSETYKLRITVSGSAVATQMVDAELVYYKDLELATLVAYFPPGTAYSTTKYAVTQIEVIPSSGSGSTVAISLGTYQRPDKRDEQYLIVNLQCSA